ncbi:MAG: cation:proton antiporter [Epsilonproteobacteria bacterium]|jgi:Kef-type K+ transport system membrane component KefB|nr:cation:proton antiporter [Campylobacterota bacterium]NPA89395.1 cation:proton antiporter [Campylobacterota bacterium]
MHGAETLGGIIIALAIIIFISPFLSNLLKLPISIVEMVLGALGGAVGILHSQPIFDGVAEFGFLYLMLLAGMEVDLRELAKERLSFYLRGGLFLLLLYLFSALFVKITGYPQVFLVIFSLISIGLMLAIQQELGKSDWLSLALKVGVLGELWSIIVFSGLNAYFEYGLGKKFFLILGLLVGILVGVWFLFQGVRALFWWFPQIKYRLMPAGIDKYHQDIRVTASLFFIIIVGLMSLHIDVVLGAFLVGVFVKTFFSHNHELEAKLAPFGFGLMIPLFFIHVGTTLNFHYLSLTLLLHSLEIMLVSIGIRYLAGFLFPMEGLTRLKFALSLSMPLTLMIATATIAWKHQFIDDYWYNVLVTTAILEVVVVMLTLKYIAGKRKSPNPTPHSHRSKGEQ